MSSLRQITADRANALKSTGPVTDAGKDRSRRNSLKHGLSGSGVVTPDDAADALAARTEEWRSAQYAPSNPQAEWFFRQVVACSLVIDACQAHDRTLTEYAALRAELIWDADRTAAAETLAEGLSRKPQRVARRLRQTKQGALWLGTRWAALKATLDRGQAWSEADRTLALDLLGIPLDSRDDPGLLADPAALAAREWLALADQLENALDELDAFERTATEAGLPTAIGPDLRLVRRYHAAAWARMTDAESKLKQEPAPEPKAPVAYDPYKATLPPRKVMTEEDFAAGLEYDRELFQKLMESQARKAAEAAQAEAAVKQSIPTAFDMEPVRLRDSLPSSPGPQNRKQRRAAARHAARSR